MKIRFAIVISMISCGISLASEIPVGTVTSERLFLLARELYGRGLLDEYEYSDLSYQEFNTSANESGGLIDQYETLRQDFISAIKIPGMRARLEIVESNRQYIHNDNFIKLFPSLNAAISDRFSANVDYRLDGELGRDPRYEGKSWRGVAGIAENATLEYRTTDLNVRFGIERHSWGFGHSGNLMFSREAMPMTVLAASYRRGIIGLESMTGFLSPIRTASTVAIDTTSFNQRYMSAHSFTIKPIKGLSFSLREAVIYGGPGRRLEPAYLFPLIWYHGEQLNSGFDDNVLSSVAVDYRSGGRLWVYGELLIDDFQIERGIRGNKEPNQLGYLAGTEVYDILLPLTTVAFEYVRICNRTYNQVKDYNRYINENYPIGFPGGPDQELLDWRVSWWAAKSLRISYFGSHQRRGEGRIDSPWTTPWLDVDNYSEPFPTGSIERSIVNGIDISAYDKNRLWGNFKLEFTDIDNVANIPGTHEKRWGMTIDIGIKLPPIIGEF